MKKDKEEDEVLRRTQMPEGIHRPAMPGPASSMIRLRMNSNSGLQAGCSEEYESYQPAGWIYKKIEILRLQSSEAVRRARNTEVIEVWVKEGLCDQR